MSLGITGNVAQAFLPVLVGWWWNVAQAAQWQEILIGNTGDTRKS